MAAVAARAVAERLRIRIGLDGDRGYWNGDLDCRPFAVGYDVFLECGRYVDCLLIVDSLETFVARQCWLALDDAEKVLSIFGARHRLSLTEDCQSITVT